MKHRLTLMTVAIYSLALTFAGCSKDNSSGPTGDFSVGDRGPAGGWIFYDKGTYSNGWRYLEAAPVDLAASVWTYVPIGYTDAPDWDIGTGKANTAIITGQNGHGNCAAQLCIDYVVSGCDDWFLPSVEELNKMYENLKAKGVGGFSNSIYWSSTEHFEHDSYCQDFSIGTKYALADKDTYHLVRAIRAF
jgi:hypothetical protein